MKMNFWSPVLILLCSSLLDHSVGAAEIDEAAAKQECGNLHRLDFHTLPNSSAAYSNQGCTLKCTVGGQILSSDALFQGFACPGNAQGTCHNGQCTVDGGHHSTQPDPLSECSNLLHIDFTRLNSTGTLYSDNVCFVKCMINGAVATATPLNEGFPCPGNHDGICKNGHCILPEPTNITAEVLLRKLTQIDVHIVGANFSTTVEYLDPFASVCIADVKANLTEVGKQSIPCRPEHQCATRILAQTVTDSVHWNTHCRFQSIHQPFIVEDSLLVQVEYERNKLAGAYVEGLAAHLEHAYRAGHFNAPPFSFPVMDKVEIKREGKAVGVVEIELRYYLNHM